jgi:hypothetical protein
VHWHKTARLHSHCGDLPPTEFEAALYAAQQPDPAGLESNSPSLQQTRGSVAPKCPSASVANVAEPVIGGTLVVPGSVLCPLNCWGLFEARLVRRFVRRELFTVGQRR